MQGSSRRNIFFKDQSLNREKMSIFFALSELYHSHKIIFFSNLWKENVMLSFEGNETNNNFQLEESEVSSPQIKLHICTAHSTHVDTYHKCMHVCTYVVCRYNQMNTVIKFYDFPSPKSGFLAGPLFLNVNKSLWGRKFLLIFDRFQICVKNGNQTSDISGHLPNIIRDCCKGEILKN
jgi:hypothetical protein